MTLAFFFVAAAATLTAGLFDYREHRLPNWLCVVTLLLGLAIHLLANQTGGLLYSVLGFLVAFVPMFIGWQIGGVGAGDAKYAGALGAVLGPPLILSVLIGTMLVASVWMLIARSSQTNSSKTKRPRVPMAVPMALATFIVLGAAQLMHSIPV